MPGRSGDGHLFPKPEPTYLRAHLPGCPHDVRADALPACDVIGRVGEAGVSTRCPITGAVFVLLTSIDIYTRAFTSYCQMQQHFCGFTLVHLLAIVRCNNTYRSLLSYFQILMTWIWIRLNETSIRKSYKFKPILLLNSFSPQFSVVWTSPVHRILSFYHYT